AIYPTGITPKSLKPPEQKVYDLIVKRFLATFGDWAMRETITVAIAVKDEIFIAKGTTTKERGWHVLYEPYVNLKEEELPPLAAGDEIVIKKITLLKKETQPPKRYTESSLVKELEKRGLGTKSTRAAIIETLFQRGYVAEKSLQATKLGIRIVTVLSKYSPEIIDEQLTKRFDEDMELIIEDKKKEEEILDGAKDVLTGILTKFRKQEKSIGAELREAWQETQDKQNTLGDCPICKKGKLVIKKGKYGLFIACNQYPECTTTFKLPQNGLVKPADAVCEACSTPMILVVRKKKRPEKLCINPACPTKKLTTEEKKEVKAAADKPCPKCGTGTLVLRTSVYGSFLGCSNYPKCRHTEQLNG
ncbi:DNA topoisomerase I, partial [Candidatus Woesearchaeota archaeon CG_4_10_14_0_8_um_filter_47_5]